MTVTATDLDHHVYDSYESNGVRAEQLVCFPFLGELCAMFACRMRLILTFLLHSLDMLNVSFSTPVKQTSNALQMFGYFMYLLYNV